MRKIVIITALLVSALLVFEACGIRIHKPIPKPPRVPPEVLSVWKSSPSPQGYPPDLSGSVILQPYGSRGSHQDSTTFHLYEGQWIDVIASSSDTFVYFGTEKPGEACFKIACHTVSEAGTAGTSYWDWSGISKDCVFAPFYGKTLYENWATDTDKGRVFATAARLFAWEGTGSYYLEFTNFNPHQKFEIAYRVYKLATTPDWGKDFEKTKLQPWLNELYSMNVSGKISDEEYDEAENQWLEQFK